MTYALILIKGNSGLRNETSKILHELPNNSDFERATGVKVEKVLISFGWPDFILLVKSENVEMIKHAIVYLRERACGKGDNVETSTIICVTQEEMDKKRKEWANSF